MKSKRIVTKKYKILTVLILTYSLFLVGCNETSNSDIEYYKNENENLKLESMELNEIINNYKNNENIEDSIIEKSNTEVLNILHVKEISGTYYIVLTVKSDEFSKEQLWQYDEDSAPTLLVEGIDINIETRNQYLYCNVLKKTSSDEYVEEVLKFDNENNESLIYKGKNVEISSSPDGEYLIIIENLYKDSKNVSNLKILDKNDKVIFDEIIELELFTELKPYGWNKSKVWSVFTYTGDSMKFLILDTKSFEYEVLKTSFFQCFEYELNIRTGWICYSDFPQLRDIYNYNDFINSNKKVNLFLYNIYTNEKIKIATSIAKPFDPKWIDDYTFVYKNPVNNERVLYKLNY